MKFSPAKFLEKLPREASEKWPDGVPFVEVFNKDSVELEFFAPRGKDYQTPHEKDEIYFIVSGYAELVTDDDVTECRPGDAVFVGAFQPHHFEKMSYDFATWVVFF